MEKWNPLFDINQVIVIVGGIVEHMRLANLKTYIIMNLRYLNIHWSDNGYKNTKFEYELNKFLCKTGSQQTSGKTNRVIKEHPLDKFNNILNTLFLI